MTKSRTDHKGNSIPIYSVGLRFTEYSDEKVKKFAALLKEYEREHVKTDLQNLSDKFEETLELRAD